MAIELISKIKPKNNGNFKLVDVEDIEYNGKGLDEAIVSGEFKGDKGDRGDVGPIGPAGPTGPKGDNGNDGFSPTVSVAEDVDGVTVTVQNKDGAQTAKVKNGKDYEHSGEFSALAEQVRSDKESVEQSKTSVEQTVAQAEGKIDTAGAIAIQGVQNEGTTQTEKVTVEGTKQITEIQSKGEEILHSFPQDFPTQMDTKLDKQQGIENKGKVLVIGEDGNVVPEEVASGGGDGIAIVNTASGESPLVIPDSAERVNKGFGLTGKTEQVQTTGKNLFDIEKASAAENYVHTEQLANIDISSAIVFNVKKNTNYCLSVTGKAKKMTVNFNIANDIQKKSIMNELKMTETVNSLDSGKIYIGFSGGELSANIQNLPKEYFNIQLEEGKLSSEYEPYTGLKASPSPEYPQEIKSAGKWNEEKQKYEIDVKITGKNLLNLQKEPDVKGVYQGWKVGNGESLTLGVKDKGNNADIKGYYIGFSDQRSESNGVVWVVDNGVIKVNSLIQRKAYVSIFPANETTVKKLTDRLDIQCEYGSIATDYQPYKEQTLTLTSDRPITKWDRLIEQGGEIGWLYGSVIATIDETASISLYAPNGFYVYVKNIDKKEKTGYCDKLYAKKMSNGEPFVLFGNANNNGLYTLNTQEFYGKTVSEIRAKLKEYPLNIIGKSETTEFVPLPQSEQNAIRALTTYYPTTVITVDGGELDPDIEVTYTADTKNYIDNKFAQLQKSLVNTQVQLL